MEFWDVINGRRSVRSFDSKPVSREVLVRLMHAASQAPSAMNSQPWRFHVAEGSHRSRIGEVVASATAHLQEFIDTIPEDAYEEAVRWYSSLGDAPIVIAVSIPKPESEFDEVNKVFSVGAASENLMLAAVAEGLATCNITFAWWVKDALGEAFEVGEDRMIVSLIACGYAKGGEHPRPSKDTDVARWLD